MSVISPLQWRYNGRDGVSNHQRYDCFLKLLFRCRSKKASKLRVTGLCEGNSPVTGEFPGQRVSNAEYVSIWWGHHARKYLYWGYCWYCPKIYTLLLSRICIRHESVYKSSRQRWFCYYILVNIALHKHHDVELQIIIHTRFHELHCIRGKLATLIAIARHLLPVKNEGIAAHSSRNTILSKALFDQNYMTDISYSTVCEFLKIDDLEDQYVCCTLKVICFICTLRCLRCVNYQVYFRSRIQYTDS